MTQSTEADETKFNETLKRMLESPPKPHKPVPEAKARPVRKTRPKPP